jgi:predicted TIM-barrel fold metal-dependent hydrolase
VVIVHPSTYGTDNACTLDALRALGPRARGVAVIDNDFSNAELQRMHAAGIRGVRLNLESAGERDPGVARRLRVDAAERVAPFGWHVQVFAALSVIHAASATILELPVPVVVDHFGLPQGEAGFDSLIELVRCGKAYVKLSAPHRIAKEPDCADAAPYAQALARANPERLLWGSDWPHPAMKRSGPADQVQPFDRIDDARALARLGEWLPGLREKILVANPARLYDF